MKRLTRGINAATGTRANLSVAPHDIGNARVPGDSLQCRDATDPAIGDTPWSVVRRYVLWGTWRRRYVRLRLVA